MTYRIAIIKTLEYYPGYGDEGSETIIQSITDWAEVTDDEFKTLKAASSSMGFVVLEQPVDTPKFVAKTVADYKAFVIAEEARKAEAEKKRDELALERKFKKELKDKASKEKMLAKLSEELGVKLVKKC